jgi:hypothetical protein
LPYLLWLLSNGCFSYCVGLSYGGVS